MEAREEGTVWKPGKRAGQPPLTHTQHGLGSHHINSQYSEEGARNRCQGNIQAVPVDANVNSVVTGFVTLDSMERTGGVRVRGV